MAVDVLHGEQGCAETFGRGSRPGRLPHLRRQPQQIPLDLPTQRRIGIQQPAFQRSPRHQTRLANEGIHARRSSQFDSRS